MNIKEAIIDTLINLLPMYGMSAEYQGESEVNYLVSANQVNIVIGITSGLKGNIVVGLRKTTALRIASAMIGDMTVTEFDALTKSAVGELGNMLIGYTVGKLSADTAIEFSPPTIAIGERMFAVISKVKSYKLTFKLNDEIFNVSYCLE